MNPRHLAGWITWMAVVTALAACVQETQVKPPTLTIQATQERGLIRARASQQNQQRHALVIGNAAYRVGRLRNPVNDARAMAEKLKALGFQVTLLTDAGQRAMEDATRAFARKLRGKGHVGLFYYAGHGVELAGQNYLIPVDAEIEDETDIQYKTVPAGAILERMRHADNGLNLVILDACRNNPFTRGFRGVSQGLTKMGAPSGTEILYATQPGKVAADGNGKHGIFTEKLLAALDRPGLSIEEVLKHTAREVKRATGGKQTPWAEGMILGDFYFTPPSEETTNPPQPKTDPERLYWQTTKRCGKPACYRAYLAAYPHGRFAALAQAQLAEPSVTAPPKLAPAKRRPYEPEMIALRGGCFQMGSPASEKGRDSDEHRHRVCVKDFEIGRYEVTNAQYRRFDPSHDSGKYEGLSLNGDDQPVVNVSWKEATAYAAWLSKQTGRKYRLPTEAEWEYAARAGTSTRYWWGDEVGRNHANCGDCGSRWDGKKIAPVGSFPPNPWGLYDTAGNVYEWTCSDYDKDYGGAEQRCSTGGAYRANRGGSWSSFPGYVRSAYRYYDTPGFRISLLGFRLSRTSN